MLQNKVVHSGDHTAGGGYILLYMQLGEDRLGHRTSLLFLEWGKDIPAPEGYTTPLCSERVRGSAASSGSVS